MHAANASKIIVYNFKCNLVILFHTSNILIFSLFILQWFYNRQLKYDKILQFHILTISYFNKYKRVGAQRVEL